MTKRLIRFVLLVSLFFLFGAPTIYFDARLPAIVDLPEHISTVALIDRSHSTNAVVNLLEKGLLGALNKEGGSPPKVCIDGLHDQINGGKIISAVRSDLMIKRPGSSLEFPNPIPWDEVSRLCIQYQTDALIAVEMFDVELLSDQAQVKVGFRLYDPVATMVIDQYQFFHTAGWKRPDTTLEGVIVRLASEEEAIYDASYHAGARYGRRILPSWQRVERKYYDKSKRDMNLATGARMMEVNDWDAAIESLQIAVESGHRKTRGRAAHNLAVVYEIRGEHQKALEWARAAWGLYENKDSKDYPRILNRRINEVELIEQQEQN